MSSLLPIDNAVINGASIPSSEFVHGTADYVEQGQDQAVTTSDGKIHNIRQAVTGDSSFEVYGKRTELSSDRGGAVACSLKKGETLVASFSGIVTAVYDDSRKTTQVTIKRDAT